MAETEIEHVVDIEPDEAGLDDEAMASYRAGKVVPHAKVAEWLDTWGTPDKRPCPKPEFR